MPCHEDLVAHSFPSNFEPDTKYFQQALAEHNADRVASGLPVQGYLELSHAEQRDVLDRAVKLKPTTAPRYVDGARRPDVSLSLGGISSTPLEADRTCRPSVPLHLLGISSAPVADEYLADLLERKGRPEARFRSVARFCLLAGIVGLIVELCRLFL